MLTWRVSVAVPGCSPWLAMAKSVMERRMERRRPSGRAMTTNEAPRGECMDTSSNCCPLSACRESMIVT